MNGRFTSRALCILLWEDYGAVGQGGKAFRNVWRWPVEVSHRLATDPLQIARSSTPSRPSTRSQPVKPPESRRDRVGTLCGHGVLFLASVLKRQTGHPPQHTSKCVTLTPCLAQGIITSRRPSKQGVVLGCAMYLKKFGGRAASDSAARYKVMGEATGITIRILSTIIPPFAIFT
ncbi:MAG: hypothetical protein Q9227_008510 [Pyrenula ochraceoflavens]